MSEFLETDRLIIKLTSVNDFDDILALRSDPRVQKYTTQPPATKQDVQRFLGMIIPYQEKHGHGMASVFGKSTGEFVGQVNLGKNADESLRFEIKN